MSLREDVDEFLARWARLMEARNVERHADLFLRDPAPVVTFSDGWRATDWLDVRVRLKRDLERVHIERVEVHDALVRELAEGVVSASFLYDLHVRDMWGMAAVATRMASLVLVETKDGLRIATAHYSLA